jgi:hypothetical protein
LAEVLQLLPILLTVLKRMLQKRVLLFMFAVKE